MMMGSNLFSLFFTGVPLFLPGATGGADSLAFMQQNPDAMLHVCLLSLTSATGQLCIYYTIKRFGPVVFTTIMTTRQMLSMVLSCLLYGHSLKVPTNSPMLLLKFGLTYWLNLPVPVRPLTPARELHRRVHGVWHVEPRRLQQLAEEQGLSQGHEAEEGGVRRRRRGEKAE